MSDHLGIVTTELLPQEETLRMQASKKDPATSCSATFSGAQQIGSAITDVRESILGVDTVKIVIESYSRRITEWLAPSLGCLSLKRIAEFREEGKSELSNPSELTTDHIDFGEPDSSLFDVPSSYEEVPPSEFQLRDLTAKGQISDSDSGIMIRTQFARRDAIYSERRVK